MNDFDRTKRPQFTTEVVEEDYSSSPFSASQTQSVPEPPVNEPQAAIPEPMIETAVVTSSGKKKFELPHIRNFMFIIPAAILVGTMLVVAYVTRTDFVVREPDTPSMQATMPPLATPEPTPLPEIVMNTYSTESYTFKYPDTFVLAECDSLVALFINEDQDVTSLCSDESYIMSLSEVSGVPDYLNNEELVATESATIAGEDNMTYEIKASGSNIIYLPFLLAEQDYIFTLKDITYRTTFLDIVTSFTSLIDMTVDWNIYENADMGYEIKYPEDWFLNENLSINNDQPSTVTISKNNDDSRFQKLTIQALVDIENAPITATEAVSSTRSLAGWDETPTTELRSISDANAQVIKGYFEGVWNVYAIIWSKNDLYQMVWEDTANRGSELNFEQMLASFSLL